MTSVAAGVTVNVRGGVTAARHSPLPREHSPAPPPDLAARSGAAAPALGTHVATPSAEQKSIFFMTFFSCCCCWFFPQSASHVHPPSFGRATCAAVLWLLDPSLPLLLALQTEPHVGPLKPEPGSPAPQPPSRPGRRLPRDPQGPTLPDACPHPASQNWALHPGPGAGCLEHSDPRPLHGWLLLLGTGARVQRGRRGPGEAATSRSARGLCQGPPPGPSDRARVSLSMSLSVSVSVSLSLSVSPSVPMSAVGQGPHPPPARGQSLLTLSVTCMARAWRRGGGRGAVDDWVGEGGAMQHLPEPPSRPGRKERWWRFLLFSRKLRAQE